jgi:ABC-type transport system involved in multi-copper enzyme maturation permease subunit
VNLVRSELLKIRTTNTWWLFALGAFVTWALAFLYNAVSTHLVLDQPPPTTEGLSPQEAETIAAQSDPVNLVAGLYTSGQYFGLLFVTLLGIVLMTGEFHHQTATTTFLTTPRRASVVVAKLIAAVLFGAAFWLVTTIFNLVATVLFLASENLGTYLGNGDITRAILLNLLAYTLWGVLGVGFGVLIRSQIGATVTAVVLYLVGTTAASVAFFLLSDWLNREWINELQVIVPSIASQLMITGTELPGSPPQWVGAAILVAYAVVTATIGTLIVQRRDIS